MKLDTYDADIIQLFIAYSIITLYNKIIYIILYIYIYTLYTILLLIVIILLIMSTLRLSHARTLTPVITLNLMILSSVRV